MVSPNNIWDEEPDVVPGAQPDEDDHILSGVFRKLTAYLACVPKEAEAADPCEEEEEPECRSRGVYSEVVATRNEVCGLIVLR